MLLRNSVLTEVASRTCVRQTLRLTLRTRNGADPGPVINYIVISTRNGVINRNCRRGTNRPRTRIGTLTRTGRVTRNTATCMALRPYTRCKHANPYYMTLTHTNVDGIIITYLSPGPGITNRNLRCLHLRNVRIIANMYRGRTRHLGRHFFA